MFLSVAPEATTASQLSRSSTRFLPAEAQSVEAAFQLFVVGIACLDDCLEVVHEGR